MKASNCCEIFMECLTTFNFIYINFFYSLQTTYALPCEPKHTVHHPPLFLLKGDRVSSKSFEGGGCMWTHQIPYNSQPLPPSHKCLDIDLQLCIWDVCLIFLITAHLITRLLINEIHLPQGIVAKFFEPWIVFWLLM